ncbi:MAG: polymerase subunit gamma/tau, partial [Acidimicrobiaceae bacterium]|nr:polymerase subunit gamma/tau [Acidimicrobiaceae bacterium]
MADQPYQSLYRRYRPQRFSEVRGQDHVTRALRNAVRDQKVAHAYLFSGPRGTGKTSTARILAKALNCTNLQDGEPCGLCDSCVQVQRGASLDVVELDAASNRKLDEMRDLLSRVALGTPGRWKVYIIDEVHQLTGDASSALLKTLEEPPAHVIFVLATTDPQKVLPTIRSRTQHFEFRLLPGDVLAGLVRDVNEAAGLGVAPEAIDLVVRKGSGSARDALSVLDQVAAAGEVSDDAAIIDAIVEALCARDAGSALVAVAEGMAAGRDPRQLAIDLVAHLRNAFLATQAKSLVALPDEALAHVEDQARRMGVPALVRAMETLGETQVEMREALDTRVSLEVALVRIARPEADISPAALLERIERLERGLSGHVAAPAVAEARQAVALPAAAPSANAEPGGRPALGALRRPAQAAAPAPAPAAPAPAAPAPAAPAPAVPAPAPAPPHAPPPPSPAPRPAAAGPGLPSRDEVTKAWGDGVFTGLKGMTKALYAGGRFTAVDDGAALFALPDEIHRARCEERRAEVEAALKAHFGAPVPLRLIVDAPIAEVS